MPEHPSTSPPPLDTVRPLDTTYPTDTEALNGFTPFKLRFFPRLEHVPHLDLLDQHLEAVESASGGRLIVSMPPRHGKSLTVSRLFPAWWLARHPDQRVIMASYAASLATRHSRLTRNLMLAPLYQAWSNGVRPATAREGSASVQSWDIAAPGGLAGGGMDAVGVGGGITGKGAHLIIVDDPVKSRAEAESRFWREKIWDWFLNDLFTRREPGANVIVVMTRWHPDDLVGRLLRSEPDAWRYLRLPALAEADDPLGRAPGEALWEERFSRQMLEDTRRLMGESAFAGLYQQNPVTREGGMFKAADLRVIESANALNEEFAQVVRFWDLALTASPHSDYSAGVKMAVTRSGSLVILDVLRFRKTWDGVRDAVIRTARDDSHSVFIGIEAAAGGKQVVAELLRELQGIYARAVKPAGAKHVRAQSLAAKAEAGQLYIVRGAWTDALIEEFVHFPNGIHDDQVDAAVGAYSLLSGGALQVSTTTWR
ncbi:MAG: phage terminase large subunit [bacterium]|nr:phage terminase large subunit [bacterium]